MSGITFNSVNSSVHGLIVKAIRRQILPENGDTYIQISGRNGSYLFPGKLKDYIAEVDCVLSQSSYEDLQLKIHDIAAWLHTTERESLIFGDEPGKYYMAKQEGAIDPEQIATLETFTVRFRYEPGAYGAEVQASFAADAVTVTNTGTHEALPVFNATFTAVATEWKVTLGTKYVRVVHNFVIGDTLEVNCVTGAVLINGARAMDKLDWQNSDLELTLSPGENTLSILPVSVCTAIITFNPRWL